VRRTDGSTCIELLPAYIPGLLGLKHFSHVVVAWWANQSDHPEARKTLTTCPPYTPEREMGVFATRSPLRPNPIGLTTCEILAVNEEEGILTVHSIDALDNTPVIDLKAYYPTTDRVKDYRLPAWLSDWPEWIPPEGLGLD
jgi:tRNA-Thr(GGU) m(6)t(6)A37 methyltransferase TsaA